MPKPGKGIISKEEDILTKRNICVGDFPGNDQLNNYYSTSRINSRFIKLTKNSAYQIVIKIKNQKTDILKENLLKKLGNNIIIKKQKRKKTLPSGK